MDNSLLQRAAAFLTTTKYQQASNKCPTAGSISGDIAAVFDSPSPTDSPAYYFYRGFQQMLQPLTASRQTIEHVLGFLFEQIHAMLRAQKLDGQNWAAAYVLATLAAVRAAVEAVQSAPSPDSNEPERDQTPSATETSGLIAILESIDWGMNRADLRNAFTYMQYLGEHPEQNGIGFSTQIHGIDVSAK